jgi:hypothetical protein
MVYIDNLTNDHDFIYDPNQILAEQTPTFEEQRNQIRSFSQLAAR